MARYRVTFNVLVDVNVMAKSKDEAVRLAEEALLDLASRDWDTTHTSNTVTARLLGDSLELSVVEEKT
ncbi:hypothetical protein LCGC14_0163850 [marine sediment metagenome]|uniref:Uncharacterized protein n=1 Tax=marine sediment metagenome TaxID=412755 RepID=A0A0F9XCL9_9ZZZZ